ncbi:hypothetical protein NAEGRDRAFT_77939 [Naegleria gruberi]|uniref:Uncharacterized protein n=1 Tax=Naegleria gruberi TaxID=5762 RepID=D2UZL7_NAEGR|nr:uncharacterized protein NAEGRDRAFT_77939 [Naegleria gruberi]EFC50177.1 hypothetical protein NAEGRDRAFT_77939 [Naegleria gruberi]|eukprot:XP_002682921.1 hypothetical protein NAEGRDRAFT_77939 [Naegleria gruberi strain NEG-M]
MNRNSSKNTADKNRKSKQSSSSNDKTRNNKKDSQTSKSNKLESKQINTSEKKKVSFSSSVEEANPTSSSSNIEKNSIEPKRKLRDVGKLIISPPEPVGYLVVYSNAKKAVRQDLMTLWKLDPNSEDYSASEQNYLSEIRFGTDEKSNNVQIKRAVNKDWPILENHCHLTYLDNSTVLILEEGALVVVNGVAYKNCDTDENDIINTNRVSISNGDIIDLDGRLLIYSKYNNPSYLQGYQEKFDEYIRERNKRKRDEEEEKNKKAKVEQDDDNEDEDFEGLEDYEDEEDSIDQEMIDSEEINNTLSEYNEDEEEAQENNHEEAELGGLEGEITVDEHVPKFFSQSPQTPQLRDLKTNLFIQPEESQIDEDNIVIDQEFLEEIIEKLNGEASAKIEELEKKLSSQEKNEQEHKENIKILQAKLEEESNKSKKLEEANKKIQLLEKQLADKDEDIDEFKRSLEKAVQRAEKGDNLKKENEKQKFKLKDMEGKLEEKSRLIETTLEENRILKLSSDSMRSQLSLLRKNSFLYESLKDLLQKNETKSFWENFEAITKLVSETMKKSQPTTTSGTRTVDNDATLILSADDIESSQISSPNQKSIKATAKKPLLLTKQALALPPNNHTSKGSAIFVKPQYKPTIDTQELIDNMIDNTDHDYSAILEEDYQDYENLSD